jgi:Uma2 family endonuclease
MNPILTLLDLNLLPEDGRQYQLIEGELVMSVIANLTHQRIVTNLLLLLGKYLEQNPLGEIIVNPALLFSEFDCLVADIAYISALRREEVISCEQIFAAPDLIVEVLSNDFQSQHRDRSIKRQLYAKYGVKEYWIVSSQDHSIEIYRSPRLDLVKILQGKDILSSPLLTGFYSLSQDIFKTYQ